MEKKISRGISADVDLTEHHIMQNGVGPAEPSFSEETPGNLLWKKNGDIIQKSSHTSDWISTTNANIIWNYDNVIIDNSTSLYDVYDVCDLAINFHKSHDELVAEAIARFKDSGDARFLGILLPKLTVHGDRIYYDVSPHQLSTHRWITSTSSTIHNPWYDPWYADTTSPITSGAVIDIINGTDITPDEFALTHLSNSEKDGGLILGDSSDIPLKVRLRALIWRVEELLETYGRNKGISECTCTLCGKKYRSWLKCDRCPECVHTILFDDTSNVNILGRPIDLRLDVDACSSVEDALCMDDPSEWYHMRSDKTPDFFFEPVYDDRGIHLIRRERNSHELQITLDGGEIIDTHEQPYRSSMYHLTYEKEFMVNPSSDPVRINEHDWIVSRLM